MLLAGQGRDEEAYAQFLSGLDRGIAKPREADIALIARMGEKTVFKLLTNSEDLLFGWNDHEALYNAFRNPEGDHQALTRSLENFLALHPERRSYALHIARPYLGNLSAWSELEDSYTLVFWSISESHTQLRQTEEFRNFIRHSGILDYWLQNEFPPQCRAVGDGDFECG